VLGHIGKTRLAKLTDKGVLLAFGEQRCQMLPGRVGLWPFFSEGNPAEGLRVVRAEQRAHRVRENVWVLSSCKSSSEPSARMSR
jgi:hypothetical protein